MSWILKKWAASTIQHAKNYLDIGAVWTLEHQRLFQAVVDFNNASGLYETYNAYTVLKIVIGQYEDYLVNFYKREHRN